MGSLTRVEAAQRARLLRVESYTIELDLTGATGTGATGTGATGTGATGTGEPGAGSGGFTSTTTVRFHCAEPGASSFIDLKSAAPPVAHLNGARLAVDGDDDRLALPDLAADNELVVTATMAYSNSGQGLHRFRDPEDGATYLYAQSALDDARRVFACFDQPDLKAPVTLRVTAPDGWLVAANGPVARQVGNRWEFAPTPAISTYLVSLIAGPWHVERAEHDGIPLELYCRRSLAAYLEADELFTLTRATLDEYHRLFGVRYPFAKYGQAFVPEFNLGAMENPGLVTLRDEFVFRSAVTEPERESRAVVIAHEMAHMWFGDLVTMRWWDDLWLNESFAEYMGYRVVADTTRFTATWTGFAVARKGWGYVADQRPSTHPVAPEAAAVPDVKAALLNFDGISYAKGASALRQLQAWIGDEAFLAGIRRHLTTHAFGNATLDDFLGALAAHTDRDVLGWARQWLRHAGVNTLRPVEVDGTLHIVQEGDPARPHRLGVAVYSGGSASHRDLVDVAGADTVVGAVPAGDLLLLNDGDLTFAKVRLRAVDLPATLPGLRDPLARALVWGSVVDSVRDGECSALALVELFAAAASAETAPGVLSDVMRMVTCRPAEARAPLGGLVARYLPAAELPAAEARVAATCLALAGESLVAFRGFIATAGPGDVATLRGWLAGASAPQPMDADLGWQVITRLAMLDAAGARDIEERLRADPTAAGEQHAARALAARPDPAGKAQAWQVITEDVTRSNRLVVAAAEGFWVPGQDEVTAPYVARYFEQMPRSAQLRVPDVTTHVAACAYPRFAARQSTVDLAVAMLEQPGLEPALRRVVVDSTDELRRAIVGRAMEGRPMRGRAGAAE